MQRFFSRLALLAIIFLAPPLLALEPATHAPTTTETPTVSRVITTHKGEVKIDRWEHKIREYEDWDKKRMPDKGGVVFVGASSIVMWELDEVYAEFKPIKRGFGGSLLPETTYYAKRIITKYEPKAVVIYTGENDIAGGRPVDALFQDFKDLIAAIQAGCPDAEIVFLGIKPTTLRWRVINELREFNAKVEEYCKGREHLAYVDTHTPILGKDGKPRPDIFRDNVHLNGEGYKLWDATLRPVLKEIFADKPPHPSP